MTSFKIMLTSATCRSCDNHVIVTFFAKQVGLAVGDIKGILEAAVLKRRTLQVTFNSLHPNHDPLLPLPSFPSLILSLTPTPSLPQVELALSVEELFPRRLRRWFIIGSREISPNRSLSLWERFRYSVWGGERFDSSEKISNALHPRQVSSAPLPPLSLSLSPSPSPSPCLSLPLSLSLVHLPSPFPLPQAPILQVQQQTRSLLTEMDHMRHTISALNERNQSLEEMVKAIVKHHKIQLDSEAFSLPPESQKRAPARSLQHDPRGRSPTSAREASDDITQI